MKKKQKIFFGCVFMLLLGFLYLKSDKNIFAYKVDDIGQSKLYENGWASVTIHGPLGTDRLGIKFTNLDYKDCKVGTFNDSAHNIQVECSGISNGVYHTSIDVQKVKTKINPYTGAYTYIDFVIKYDIPAHEEYESEKKDGISYKFSTDGRFQTQATHQTKDRKQIALRCTTSVSTIGLATISQKRYYSSVLTLNLKKADRKITYNKNGNGANLSYSTKIFLDGSKYEFPSATRTGYHFVNWKDQDGKYPTTSTLICEDKILYAQWDAKHYKIHYDPNGGQGTMQDSDVTYDKKIILSDNKFSKEGYQFLGWSKRKDDDVSAYENGEEITYQTASDLVLYAVWGDGKYKISFVPNGAGGDTKIIPVKCGEETVLAKNTYEREGYTFAGWSENIDAVHADYTDQQKIKDLAEAGKTKKLYAIWKKSDGSFNTINIIHDEDMFAGDIEIEGENGTQYDNGHIDSEYARIDRDTTPGYFTKR